LGFWIRRWRSEEDVRDEEPGGGKAGGGARICRGATVALGSRLTSMVVAALNVELELGL
jgi:hypothetical protein